MPVEIASLTKAFHGGAATWDAKTQTLLWVDSPACQVHRYDPVTGRDDMLDLLQEVGAAKPRSEGGLVCNLADGVALLDTSDTRRWLVYWARDGAHCAAAAVDPLGRLWAGSAGGAGSAGRAGSVAAAGLAGRAADSAAGGTEGWLAVVEPHGAARVAVSGPLSVAGIAWSPDETVMYLVDGHTGQLDAFDYDLATAAVTGRRPVTAIPPAAGRPSEVCVDADGCLWVALDGASAVHRYTPAGQLDRVVPMPTARVTGCAFGGPGLTDLYVTTAVGSQPDEVAGALLVVADAGAGLPTTAFAG